MDLSISSSSSSSKTATTTCKSSGSGKSIMYSNNNNNNNNNKTRTPLKMVQEPNNKCATTDPIMARDPRVISNLLITERITMPTLDYFVCVQSDIQPFMRKVVATWMLEVCDEQKCEEQVFPLAINFMDRFLCTCSIARTQFQLLAAACLLMASKIRQCFSLTVDLMCAYTDYSVESDDLRKMELIVLDQLEWNLCGITGVDYIDHILDRMPWSHENPHIRQHSHTLVSVCYTESVFMLTPPSLLAAACICAATQGIRAPSASFALRDICRLTASDPLDVELTVRHIEHVVAKETATLQQQQQQQQQQLYEQQQQQQPKPLQKTSSYTTTATASSTGKLQIGIVCDAGQPETPTDVQDVLI